MTDVTGVWKDNTTFEAFNKGENVNFDKGADGAMRVEIDGFNREVFFMTAEQVAAFKTWMMEN